MFEDITLKCKDCGNEFVFTAGEQQFYADHGFQNTPVRCKSCRTARKAKATGNSEESRPARQFFTATCTRCGGEARIPFKPTTDRPVYCSNCFAEIRNGKK